MCLADALLLALVALPAATDVPALGLILPEGAPEDHPLRIAAGAPGTRDDLRDAGAIPVEIRTGAPWGGGASGLARAVFERPFGALIGGEDPVAAHVAAQIATRARVPYLTLSGAPDLTRIGDPWIFRAVPDDETLARTLLSRARATAPVATAVLLVPAGREGRSAAAALERACAAEGVEATIVVAGNGSERIAPRADVWLLWLAPAAALDSLAHADRAGRAPPVVLGGRALDDAAFRTSLPATVRRILTPRSADGRAERDALLAVAAAARAYGLAPEEIREGLQRIESFAGTDAPFRFDAAGNRVGPIVVRDDLNPNAPPTTPRSRQQRRTAVASERPEARK